MTNQQDADNLPDENMDGTLSQGTPGESWFRHAYNVFAEHFRQKRKVKKKQRASKKTYKAREREFKSSRRKFARQRFWNQMLSVFKPQTDKKDKEYHRRERKRLSHVRQVERKVGWQKWWSSFRRHPFRTVFRKKVKDHGYYVHVITRKERREARKIRRIESRKAIREVFTDPELRLRFRNTYLISSAYFLITFIIVYVLYQIVTIIVATSFHIPVIWNYYELIFPLYTYSPLYTRIALISIFAAGPIISIMIAFGCLQLALSRHPKLRPMKLLFLWGGINGFNFFFGAYIAGFITRTEFIYTSEWLFMSSMFDAEEITLTLISITMMLVIGGLVTPLFLAASGSLTLINVRYRRTFMIGHVLLPWLTGVVLFFLITTPHYYLPLILKTLTPGLAIPPMIYTCNALRYANIENIALTRTRYVKWSFVIAAVALLFFYRVILSFNWSW